MTQFELEPVRLDLEGAWLRGLLARPANARCAVLVVPPLAHEWQRSYRLFALLAHALGELGIATLRFDFRGCGDSGGDEDQFLPHSAARDVAAMAGELRRRVPVPLRVLAVRGGALLTSELSLASEDALWHWQAVVDGRAHLSELDALDLRELNSQIRYPFLRRRRQRQPDVLLGRRLHPMFRPQLEALRCEARPSLRLDRIDAAPDLVLDAGLTDWVGQLGISGSFSLPRVRDIARDLSDRCPA